MSQEHNTVVNKSDDSLGTMSARGLSAMPDMSTLNNKEREVFVEYLQNNHPGLLPHQHDNLDIAKSDGQKLFDIVTYKGLAWIGTAGLSMFAAYAFKNGAGKPLFNKAVEQLAPVYQKAMGTSEQVAHNAMTSGLMHIGLIVGGSTLLYPIKKLEDNKPQVVGYLDDNLNSLRTRWGDDPTEQQLSIQEETQKRLQAAPRQTWGSVLTGRAAGVSAVFFTAIFLARGMDNVVAEKMSGAAVEALGQSSRPSLQRISKSEKLKNVGTVVILDTAYSFISEEVLYLTTRAYENIVGKRRASQQASTPKAEVEQIQLVANNPKRFKEDHEIGIRGHFTKTFARPEPALMSMGA